MMAYAGICCYLHSHKPHPRPQAVAAVYRKLAHNSDKALHDMMAAGWVGDVSATSAAVSSVIRASSPPARCVGGCWGATGLLYSFLLEDNPKTELRTCVSTHSEEMRDRGCKDEGFNPLSACLFPCVCNKIVQIARCFNVYLPAELCSAAMARVCICNCWSGRLYALLYKGKVSPLLIYPVARLSVQNWY